MADRSNGWHCPVRDKAPMAFSAWRSIADNSGNGPTTRHDVALPQRIRSSAVAMATFPLADAPPTVNPGPRMSSASATTAMTFVS